MRLGEESITCPVDVEDHRPEVMQGWKPARTSVKDRKPPRAPASDELLPGWLLREPLALDVKADKPCYQGPLQLLTRARRLEAGWWDTRTDGPAVRDYFIARSEQAGLLWIYRERLSVEQDQARWYLHGLYA